MDRPLFSIVFITWVHLSRACDIAQSPSLLAILNGEKSTIRCDVSIPSASATQKIKTSIFFKYDITDLKTKTLDNVTTKASITHDVIATESGNYKCRVTCGPDTKYGKGTFIYVRDSGYQEPLTPAGSLQCGLIVLFVLLLLPSIMGSYLLLPFFWKKQVTPPKPSSVPAVPKATPNPTPPQPGEETSGSLYTSLQPRSDDVYDVLEEDITRNTNMSLQPRSDDVYDVLEEDITRNTNMLQAEIHVVPGPSPVKRPRPQAQSAPVQEKPRLIPDKPPTKQKTKKVTADNSLYENFKH